MRASPAEAVAAFYDRHPARRIGVAVSGGSDSLGLLHLLAERGGAELCVATVDHGLRPTSAGEALHVARVAEALGLSHDTLEWGGWDGRGNLQDQARRTRYTLLAEWAEARGLDAVALGHTMDDQAETLVMRLTREAGIDGLAAMAERTLRHGVRFDRPLLRVGRGELRDMLATLGITWVEDPSNEDEAFDRVRARRAMEVLGTLGLGAGALAQAALHLEDARAALAETAARFARRHVTDTAGDLIFDRTALRAEPAEIQRRLLGQALRWVATADYPPRRAPLDALLRSVGAREAATTLHGCRVLTSDMTVRVVREHAAVAGVRARPGALWDGRWRVEGPARTGPAEVRALGERVADCPRWRETKLPRATLLASPAVFDGDTLVAAPVAGFPEGWSAVLAPPLKFADILTSR